MSLPNLSYMMHVGQLRYIQAHCESAAYRNPDTAVGAFLTLPQRLTCLARGILLKPRLRANPFYHYILARTRYYDEVFLDAINSGVGQIFNIGCGSDTRSYRFASSLREKGITVFECDQAESIHNKQTIARRHWPIDHVRYVPLDLNDTTWSGLKPLLAEAQDKPSLVMLEGVSPYVAREAFIGFLRLLAVQLHPDSLLAYDYKIAGVSDAFGRSAAVAEPFRLPSDHESVTRFHEELGYTVQHMESGADLTRRLISGSTLLFAEDCTLRLALQRK